VLVCAVYMDCCTDRGVEADDIGEAECGDCRHGVGPEIDAGLIEAECSDVDDRLVKRRCNEGFLILRVRKDDVDGGPGNWGVDSFIESLGG